MVVQTQEMDGTQNFTEQWLALKNHSIFHLAQSLFGTHFTEQWLGKMKY